MAKTRPHRGIVVLIRRRTRAAERTALFRLLQRAGEVGLHRNINFARVLTVFPGFDVGSQVGTTADLWNTVLKI